MGLIISLTLRTVSSFLKKSTQDSRIFFINHSMINPDYLYVLETNTRPRRA